ncbi:MAG: hypothetical protein U0V70_16055 [Terriglobia bacterium]
METPRPRGELSKRDEGVPSPMATLIERRYREFFSNLLGKIHLRPALLDP